ncbi:MAG TPA: CotH kinase family protein [Bacteroidia bacterium]|nr:CotH kinase family protein [Bacteroidia bacterium]
MKRILFCLFVFFSCEKTHAADGDSIWGVNFIHDIHFNFSQTSYWDTLVANHNTDTYTSCEMIFDGTVLSSTAVRFKGNSSYNNPSQKKSLKVDLNEFVSGQDYDGIKKFNLNNGFKDPTFIREKLTLDYMRRHGIHAPRCTYARVYFNNVYWGLYMLVEDVNSKFLSQHYGNNNGNLFKGDPQGDLRWYGSTLSSYTSRYELDQSSTNDWSDLVNLIDTINNTGSSNYYNTLEEILFGQDAINNMVINNMFVNLDSYCGSGHNYYVYHDSLIGKFRWIPWDVNETFGNFNMGMTPVQLKDLAYDFIDQPNSRPLAVKMLADPTYHQTYIYTYCYLMQDFNNAYLDPYIDSLANVIRTDVYADTNKFYTDQNFEDNLTMDIVVSGGPGGFNILGLKNFITSRRASLETQLASFGCYLAVEEPKTESAALSLFPNPVADVLFIEIPEWSNNELFTYEILDVTGRVIETGTISPNGEQSSLDVSEIAGGVYILRVTNSRGTVLSSRFCRST